MKQKTFFIALSLFASLTLSAQKIKGNKNVTLENRETGFFDAIEIQDKIHVILTASDSGKVRVETDENLQEIVEVQTGESGVLHVFLSQEISRKKTLKVYIGAPGTLQNISLADKAKCTGEKELDFDHLTITAKDNAVVNLKVNTGELTVNNQDKANIDLDITSADLVTFHLTGKSTTKAHVNTSKITSGIQEYASLHLEGKTSEFVLQTDGNTNIKAKKLEAEYADIKATEKPDIFVNVSKEIIISSEDNTEIYLYNQPKIFIDKFTGKSCLYKK